MKPLFAIVGRPNVGKSTLFNAMTRRRDALVIDQPGVTRDRHYGEGEFEEHPFVVIDTGGLSGDEKGLDAKMAEQSRLAMNEADRIIFVVDGKGGLNPQDEWIARQLRLMKKPVIVAVNKTDGQEADCAAAEFYRLGFETVIPIAASHRRGVTSLLELCFEGLIEKVVVPVSDEYDYDAGEEAVVEVEEGDVEIDARPQPERIRFCVLGRPNVGKSTLTNRMLGEERVIVFDHPGTTRDSIRIDFERHGQQYTIVDTAGIRRKGRVKELVEKFSVIKALETLEQVDIAIIVLDATEGILDQDCHVIQAACEKGVGVILALNKWDGLTDEQKEQAKEGVDRKLQFIKNSVDLFTISAKHGTGVGLLFDALKEVHTACYRPISTKDVNEVLKHAIEVHQPPMMKGHRIKCRYAHLGGRHPLRIVIHGNQVDLLPDAYKRYLYKAYREAFNLKGVMIQLVLKPQANPFDK